MIFPLSKQFTDYIICFIAGGIASLAFAPYKFSILIFLSLAIFFLYIFNNRKNNSCFSYGYFYGLGFFGFGFYWLYISINLFGGVNLIAAYCITAVMVGFHALFPAFFCLIITKYLKRHSDFSLLFLIPALWTLFEWSRTWFLTGFPWLAVGYTQTENFLSSYATILGVYGVSFFIVTIASAIAYLAHGKKILASFLITICIICSAFGLQTVQWTEDKNHSLNVALLQAGIKQENKWKEEYRQKTIDLYYALSEEHWNKDLILWPETALPFFYHQGTEVINKLSKKAKTTNTELLVGIPYSDPDSRKYYNSIISIGLSEGIYLKKHLVPFGEYLPLDKYIRPILNALSIPMSNFSSGQQDKPLIKHNDYYVGLSICYEDVFGEEVIDALPEANILVNVSNDAWFGDSSAPHQHLQMAQMRAIETGRYLLRATNNGVTAIINDKGKVVKQSPQFVAASLDAKVKLFSGSTPYSVIGNYGVLLMIGLIFFVNYFYPRKALSNG